MQHDDLQNNADIVSSAAVHVARMFDEDVPSVESPELLMSALRRMITQHVIKLLSTNPERLMSMLYRIDVSESKVNEIFKTSFPLDVPEHLTDAIIERQLQKAYTRSQQ